MYVYYFLFGQPPSLHPCIDIWQDVGFRDDGRLFYYPSECRWMVPGTVSPLED